MHFHDPNRLSISSILCLFFLEEDDFDDAAPDRVPLRGDVCLCTDAPAAVALAAASLHPRGDDDLRCLRLALPLLEAEEEARSGDPKRGECER